MALLLVRTVSGENSTRYQKGDVVAVFEDGHVFGRMESLDVWLSEGHAREDWPGGFAVIKLDGLTVEEASAYVTEGVDRRRDMTIEYEQMERRSPESGRDTLRTHLRITRNKDEVASLIRAK